MGIWKYSPIIRSGRKNDIVRGEMQVFLSRGKASLTRHNESGSEEYATACPDSIDQPVLLIDPAAPATGIIAFERFWFPDAFKRRPEPIFVQVVSSH